MRSPDLIAAVVLNKEGGDSIIHIVSMMSGIISLAVDCSITLRQNPMTLFVYEDVDSGRHLSAFLLDR
jgi:hypothetical protein